MDQEEISEKIRSAIKAKLTELGCYIDDELPDYIMVMIANKKDKESMATDLELFLSENAKAFTAWLDNLLERLQSVKESVKSNKPTPQTEDKDEATTQKIEHSNPANENKENMETTAETEGDNVLTLHAEQSQITEFADDDDPTLNSSKENFSKVELKSTTNRKTQSSTVSLSEEKKSLCASRENSGDEKRRRRSPERSRSLDRTDRRRSRSRSRRRSRSNRRSRSPRKSPRRQATRRSSPDRRRLSGRRSPRRSPLRSKRSPSPRRSPVRRSERGGVAHSRMYSSRMRSDNYRGDNYQRKRSVERDRDRERDRSRSRSARRSRSPILRVTPPPPSISSRVGNVIKKEKSPQYWSDWSDYSDDERVNKKSGVQSVVKELIRKREFPDQSKQANKKLLLRAFLDLNKSNKTQPAIIELSDSDSSPRSTDTKNDLRARLPARHNSNNVDKQQTRDVLNELDIDESDLEEMLQLLEERRRKKQTDDSTSYQTITSRLDVTSQNQTITPHVDLLPEHKSIVSRLGIQSNKPLSSRLGLFTNNSRKEESEVVYDEPTEELERAESPRFVVTLDGVQDLRELLPQSKITNNEDTQLLNTTRDESGQLVIEEDNSAQEDMQTSELSTPVVENKKDPTPQCTNYPNCTYGTRCKFKHPSPIPDSSTTTSPAGTVVTQVVTQVPCKFGIYCTRRPSCSFYHPTNVKINNLTPPASGSVRPVIQPTCKFFPKCTNMNCPFRHPKPCRFGLSCSMKMRGCKFSHPALPSKNKLRWSKDDSLNNQTDLEIVSP